MMETEPQTLDLEAVRQHYPVLSDGWAFFDNAAGSLTPRSVVQRCSDYLLQTPVNPYGMYEVAHRGKEQIWKSRTLVQQLIHAKSADEIVMGPSTTKNIDILARGLVTARPGRVPLLQAGDEIIVTNQDHEANIAAWRDLQSYGIRIQEWQMTAQGALAIEDLEPLLNPRTKLVCFTHCSNVLGTLNDVQTIVKRIHQADALACIDSVSYVPHALLDVQSLDVDFCLYSTAKAFGPHLGILYGKQQHLAQMGGQFFFNESYDNDADRLSTGNVQYELMAGVVGTFDYFESLYTHHFSEKWQHDRMRPCLEKLFALLQAHEETLTVQLVEAVADNKSCQLIGPPTGKSTHRFPIVSLTLPQTLDKNVWIQHLDQAKIGVSIGRFNAYRCLRDLGLSLETGVLRMSIAHYNTASEVERLIAALQHLGCH